MASSISQWARVFCISCFIICANTVFADDKAEFAGTYFCTADAVGGVRYNEYTGNWVGNVFRPSGRYILNIRENSEVLERLSNEMRMTYFIEFLEHGSASDLLSVSCFTESNQLRSVNPLANFISKSGYFACNLFGGELRVDLGALRFLKSYTLGYVDGVDDNSDTPHIMIGTCSRVN